MSKARRVKSAARICGSEGAFENSSRTRTIGVEMRDMLFESWMRLVGHRETWMVLEPRDVLVINSKLMGGLRLDKLCEEGPVVIHIMISTVSV